MRIYNTQYRALKTLFLNWFKLTLSLSISLANSLRNVKQFQFYYANSHQSQGGSWNKVLGWISFYFLYINSIFQNTILNLFLYLQKNDKFKKNPHFIERTEFRGVWVSLISLFIIIQQYVPFLWKYRYF